MKILHTADLHLGRQFNGIPLDDDHAALLDQIARAIAEHDVDVLVIAGDIFDRASPPAKAVRLFNEFLNWVANETAAAVVMIAGNHDSADRVGAMSTFADKSRALIRGPVSADEVPLLLRDEYGLVAFSALPFSYEYAARECFDDEMMQTPEHVLSAQASSARSNLPDSARWVIVAHAFVADCTSSDSERALTRVGGTEMVGSSVFDGAHYVALGHLHRPQTAGAPHIRYSGSPLAFGFDEEGHEKSMNLVELDGEGRATVEKIPFAARRRVRVLRGKHADLLLNDPSDDFVKAILTDTTPVIDGMKRLREVFPNACDLTYERHERATETKSLGARNVRTVNPMDVIGGFLEAVRGGPASEDELNVIALALRELQQKEDAA